MSSATHHLSPSSFSYFTWLKLFGKQLYAQPFDNGKFHQVVQDLLTSREYLNDCRSLEMPPPLSKAQFCYLLEQVRNEDVPSKETLRALRAYVSAEGSPIFKVRPPNHRKSEGSSKFEIQEIRQKSGYLKELADTLGELGNPVLEVRTSGKKGGSLARPLTKADLEKDLANLKIGIRRAKRLVQQLEHDHEDDLDKVESEWYRAVELSNSYTDFIIAKRRAIWKGLRLNDKEKAQVRRLCAPSTPLGLKRQAHPEGGQVNPSKKLRLH
ncbi:hypothetical protein CPB83DRAFT_852284 [Crepidotus variabilis]|uniref:Uncharacterized protein n=1 Tax=Crepidotus variabilis TaxID=179855 RepID=A0A9P6EH54_9AGAR|nr:hypothetical protein CPB83DRAFT_852284 [Crepidotus variabilis]